MRAPPFTEADDAAIATKAAAGATDAEIAVALGRSQLSVKRRRWSLGIEATNSVGPWSADDERQLRQMMQEGATLREMSGVFNRTFQNVQKKIQRMERRAGVRATPAKPGRKPGTKNRPKTSDLGASLAAEIAATEATIADLESGLSLMRALQDRIGASA